MPSLRLPTRVSNTFRVSQLLTLRARKRFLYAYHSVTVSTLNRLTVVQLIFVKSIKTLTSRSVNSNKNMPGGLKRTDFKIRNICAMETQERGLTEIEPVEGGVVEVPRMQNVMNIRISV